MQENSFRCAAIRLEGHRHHNRPFWKAPPIPRLSSASARLKSLY